MPRASSTGRGLIVDLFAGGGGASTGMAAALGREPDIAFNHDALAMDVYSRNHPTTEIRREDVWATPPLEATRGRPVWVLWASPDCTHFSVAKGGKPKSKGIRSLAEVVVRWASDVEPLVIFLENVREFVGYGPLYEAGHTMPDGRVLGEEDDLVGQPIPERAGEYFQRLVGRLQLLGYVVEWRVLDASHFGAPTRRQRLFLVARRDGQPICWPEATHGPGLLPYRTAAECIDWTLPCPSIFERKRPLAEATLRRIAAGIVRFVLENPRPFVVGVGGRAGQSLATAADAPLGTVTAKNDRAVVVPHLSKFYGTSTGQQLAEPMPTITSQGNHHALVAPSVITIDHASSQRADSSICGPIGTVTAKARHALVAPTLVQTGYGERPGQRARCLDLHEPLGTVMATGQKHALVSAFLAKHFGGVVGVPLDGRPLDTVTAKDHHALATASLEVAEDGAPPGRTAQVHAFLTAYYGSGSVGQRADVPLRTVTALARLGLVTVTVEGVPHVIVDVGMRMLEPEELLRAQFGRFAEGYDLSPATSKADKVRLIGNSVCPEASEALVRANLGRKSRARAA